MIQDIVSHINQSITPLQWVDSVSGLTLAVPRMVSTTQGKELQSLPMAAGRDPDDCYESGEWKALVPDSNKTSIVFWQRQSDVSYNRGQLSKRRTIATVTLRCVCWANTSRIDIDMDEEYRLHDSLIAAIGQGRQSFTGQQNFKGWIDLLGVSTDWQTIFGQYDYSKYTKLFHYPYHGFAVDIDVRYILSSACVDEPVVTYEWQ